MVDRSSVEAYVFQSIDQLNQELPENEQIKKTASAALHGGAGPLDSLGLMNLIWGLEKQIEDDLGVRITLTNGLSFSDETADVDPFQRVDLLVDYVVQQMDQQAAA